MADKIKIYGKAQNRTALGIFHAYMVMHPEATLADLRKAFANSLNPDAGTKEIFIPAHEKGTDANWEGYFKGADEIITDANGQEVAVVKMWTKASIDRLVAKAHDYGLVTEQMLPADPGGKKGGYRLEYLNGYVPPKAKGKRGLPWWVWAIIVLAIAGAAVAIGLR